MRSTKIRLAVAAAALAFYVVFILRTSFTVGGARYFVLFEDGMISMRYARHLAEGHGLVWNIGEPPIEGFTNLLWVLWMSVAHLLGLSESKVSLFIMLSGIVILLATGLVVSKIARKLTAAPWVPIAVLAALLFDYPLVFWTLRGMEVGALALVVYTLLWLVLENEDEFSVSRTFAMGALTAGALLLRSDSVVPVALIALYGFLTCSRRWLFATTIGLFAGGTALGQTIFRKIYFHESLPNTYFLKLYKISASARFKRGVFVALQVLALHLAAPLTVLLASVSDLRKGFYEDRALRRQGLLGALFFAQVGYATYVGGDAWEWMLYANRYVCVGMPALIVLVAVVLERIVVAGADERARFARKVSLGVMTCGVVLVALNAYAHYFPERGIAATITFGKTSFAAGGAFVGLGLLMHLRDVREAIGEGLQAAARRVASQKTVIVATLVLTAIVWLPAHVLPFGRWAAQNAAQYKDEANYARLGLLIRASTPPSLRIAVAAAGATPYFAQRPTEDLLGKNDRHVAKLAPRGVFSPGHDKWDYAYSLGERRADLIVETVDVDPSDDAYITSLGFEKLDNEMRLRRDAPVARRDVLGRAMGDGAALEATLSEIHATLPRGLGGIDIGMVLGFGLVIAIAFLALVRDGESFAGLSPDVPLEDSELDDSSRAALRGADARAIPTLDGLRGIAVLLVLLFHFGLTFPGESPADAHGVLAKIAARIHALVWSGWIGVDLFFVLSGYLITRGLVAPSKLRLGARLRMFWMRRVLRIFPLYYAFIVVGLIAAVVVGSPWIPGPSYWLYMQNYTLAFDDEVFRWTAHLWSLAIEEQFYFIWPIIALVVSRRRLIVAIVVLVCAVVALRAGLTFMSASIPPLRAAFGTGEGAAKFVYRATFTRADGLLLGALVALTQREVTHPLAKAWRRLRKPICIGTGGALAALYAVANGLGDYDRRMIAVGYVTLALFFASAISLCADGMISERARRVLSLRPLVACGKVSYGMYILHWPLVVVLVPHLERMQRGMSVATQMALSGAVIVTGIAVVYVVATVSFRFFETPFLALKGRFHDGRACTAGLLRYRPPWLKSLLGSRP